eukprot:s1101_g8.t1
MGQSHGGAIQEDEEDSRSDEEFVVDAHTDEWFGNPPTLQVVLLHVYDFNNLHRGQWKDTFIAAAFLWARLLTAWQVVAALQQLCQWAGERPLSGVDRPLRRGASQTSRRGPRRCPSTPARGRRNPKLFSDETGHGSGWAVGEFNLTSDATILARLGSIRTYISLRQCLISVRQWVVVCAKGQHRVFVKAAEPGFRCEFLLDGAAARQALTGVAAAGPEKALSPFVLLKDVAVSEVIGSDLASPHLGIPILNTAREPLHLLSAAIVEEAVNLRVHPGDLPAVQLGQAMILRLKLQQGGQLTCHGQPKAFTFTVALQPEGNHAPVRFGRCDSMSLGRI